MNKKTLAIILSITLAVGAFAGLSFNLLSANAETVYVGDGTELVENGNASAMFNAKSPFNTSGEGSSLTVVYYSDAAEGKSSNGKAIKSVNRTDTYADRGNRGKFDNMTNFINANGEGKYIASVWVKVPDATGPVKIAFGFGNAAQKGDREQFTVQPDTWTKLTVVQDVTVDMYHFGLFETGDTKDFDIYIDDMSIQKAVDASSQGNQGGSNAGGSNTGDVLPIAMIAVTVISAGALVVIARRK